MPDIFKSQATIGKAWQLDGAVINFGEKKNEQIIATGFNLSYQRQNSTISPVNRKERYTVAGDPNGVISIDAIVGPSVNLLKFITAFADVCKLQENTITITTIGTQDCDSKTKKKWTCKGCLIDKVGLTVTKTGGGNMVMSNLTMSFLILEAPEGE